MSHAPFTLTYAGLTDVGVQRSVNQDCYSIALDGSLFVVADGMGGHAGGQEASRIATDTICDYVKAHVGAMDLACTQNTAESIPVILEQAVLKANQAILADQKLHPERADMGTTAVVLFVKNGEFWCVHVGDSRLYLMRESGFFQVTQDHTWVTRALSAGLITLEQSYHHPLRHVLSQCVGREDLRSVEAQRIDVEPNDQLLLCSDGLTEELSKDAIITHLQQGKTCQEQVGALVEAAKTNGGRDNITAIAISVSV